MERRGNGGVVVGLGGSVSGGDRAVANDRVHADAEGNHCEVCCGAANIQAVYRGGEYLGFQQVPTMVVRRTWPHTGIAGGKVKDD